MNLAETGFHNRTGERADEGADWSAAYEAREGAKAHRGLYA